MNIALIVLDTVRGDVFNSMLEGGKLPNIEKLTSEGTQYTNAKSNGPWTVPSHGSMFTGQYPQEHGISGDTPTYDSVPLIKELQGKGYQTAGFSANPWLSPNFNFNEPFDYFLTRHEYLPNEDKHLKLIYRDGADSRLTIFRNQYEEVLHPRSMANSLFFVNKYFRRKDEGSRHLVSRSIDWLSGSNEPYFLFMNLTEAHLAHVIPSHYFPSDLPASEVEAINQQAMDYHSGIVEPDEPEMSTLRRSYSATLRYLDDQLSRLFDTMDLTDTTVALVSDHGEHFGEYGRFAHQYGLREELVHVPMIIRTPGDQPDTVNGQVELRQLYQFFLSAADGQIELPKSTTTAISECHAPAPDLEELRERGSGELPEYVTTYHPGVRCITDGQFKLVELPNGSTELYALDAEGQDLSEKNTEKLSELKTELYDELGPFEISRSTSIDVSKSVESQLADLGYT